MIRHNHPDLKGHFTCLGNHYNVLDRKSMKELSQVLERTTIGDRKIALTEIKTALEHVHYWRPLDYMYSFYTEYQLENANHPEKLLKVDFLQDK